MLSTGLLSIALIVNLFYREGYRVLICFIAIFITIGHTVFFDDATSFGYYGTVSIACLLTILAVSFFASSPLGTDIQLISLLGIFVNIFGYYQYQAGFEPTWYDDMMIVLITAEFIRLMMRTNRDMVHDALEFNNSNGRFHIHANSGNNVNNGRHK
jgi:hypothetical protein